jgi:hypothetical protein
MTFSPPTLGFELFFFSPIGTFPGGLSEGSPWLG